MGICCVYSLCKFFSETMIYFVLFFVLIAKLNADFNDRRNLLQTFLVAQEPYNSTKLLSYYSSVHFHFNNYSYACNLLGSLLDRTDDNAGFFDYSLMETYMRWKERLPIRLRRGIKEHMLSRSLDIFVKDSVPPTLNTPNQMLMRSVAAHLAGQEFSHPKYEEATTFLHYWLAKVTQSGMLEFDSTTYHALYGAALTSLYDFTKDGLMRQKASMTLDWLYMGVADEWLQGWWISTTYRDYIKNTSPEASGASTILAWMMLGNSIRTPTMDRALGLGHVEPEYSVPSSLSSFRLPAFIEGALAVHPPSNKGFTRTVRESHNIQVDPFNPSPTLFQWVYRTAYITGSYGVTSHSEESGISVEHHNNRTSRWLIRWPSSRSDIGSTIFFQQHEEEDTPNPFTPHEQVLQRDGVMIGVYNIRTGSEAVDGWLPLTEEPPIVKAHWIFAEFEKLYLAVAVAQPFSLETVSLNGCPYERLHSPGRKNAVVMITASCWEYGSVGSFMSAVMSDAVVQFDGMDDVTQSNSPTVTLDWKGTMLLRHDGDHLLNGEPVAYQQWPLLEVIQDNATIISQEIGARLKVNLPNVSCYYDFGAWQTTCSHG